MSNSFTIKSPIDGTIITNDQRTLDRIVNALAKKEGYCPCSLLIDEDHKCQCLEYRTTGVCKCGLYVKVK